MRYLASAVILFSLCLSASLRTQSALMPICIGGPFVGPATPTYPPIPGDPRNCRAIPTDARAASGVGPMPAPSSFRADSVGYHFAGSQTRFASYTSLFGSLQVQNPDLSQSGADSHVLNTFLLTPDYNTLLQTGWIEEGWHGDVRRVFVESNLGFTGRQYFEQYPLTDGLSTNLPWSRSRLDGT